MTASVAACDSEGEAEAKVEGEVKADAEDDGEKKATLLAKADFDLETVAFLVRKKQVKDAKQLEKTINDKKKGINKVDIDGDGKVDTVVVVEVRDGGKTKFELKVLPSSKKKQKKDPEVYVAIAYIELEPVEADAKVNVKVYYDDVVDHEEEDFYSYEFEATFESEKVVVEDNEFVMWVYTGRPIYKSSYYSVEIVIEDEGCWPPGHCKHMHWGVHHDAHVDIHIDGHHHYKHKKHKHYHHRGHGKW